MKNKMYKLAVIAIFCLVLSPFNPAIVHADFIDIYGNGPLGNFEGTLRYNPSSAEFVVSLTNTSPSSNGGYLTGFVFNNPNNLSVSNFTVTGDYSKFELLGKSKKGTDFQDGINAQPFGRFDIGAALGENFQGGGKPQYGIPVYGTANFQFTLTGSNLDSLTVKDFIKATSSSGEFFVARFRGFEDGGSNKVPASPVPIPPTVWLLGAGLVGIGLIRKRIHK